MSVIPQTVQFKHTVSWEITNFDFRPRDPTPIISSKFDVRCLNVATWSFSLYAVGRCQHNFMQFAINLHYDVPELYIALVKFAVSIIDAKGMGHFKTKGAFIPSFYEPSSLPVNFIPLNDFREDQHLQKNSTLILSCDMTTTVNQVEFLSHIYSDQFVSLGRCVLEMLETPSRSDMTAHSKEGVPFEVHTCILRARCPILFSDPPDSVDFTQPKPIWHSNLNARVLKTLLFYLYGRIVTELTSDMKTELMTVALRYQLRDLERKLREYPDELNLKSEIVVEEIAFKHPLSEAIWKGYETEHRIRFLPTQNLRVSDLVVSWEVEPLSHGDDYLSTSFEFSNSVEDVPILLKCKLSLVGRDGLEVHVKEYDNVFFDYKWTPTPPFLTKSEFHLHEPQFLKCDMRISEMSYENTVLTNLCRIERGPSVLFNDLSLIGKDLRKLYENREHCDLKMEIGDRTFFGHSSFLAHRSELIEEKLEASESEASEARSSEMVTIRLDGVEPDIFQMVLLYMYSGRLEISDLESMNAVGDAASLFGLPNLLERCLFFRTG